MTPTLNLQAFDWRKDYETGAPEIDRQHRQLVRLICELNTAMTQGRGRDILGSVLDRLAAYAVTHFQTEETLMVSHHWSGFDDHQRKHRKLIADVTNLQNNFRSGKITISVDTMSFLKRWLHTHILEDDMGFAKAVREARH